MKMLIALIILIGVCLFFYIKTFKWAGILSIVLVAEIAIFPRVYIAAVLESKNTSEPVRVSDVNYEEGVNDEGEEGYYFSVTIDNQGSTMETAKIVCYTDTGTFVTNEQIGVYQGISVISPWRSKMHTDSIIPPGTQTTLHFFVTQATLDKLDGEQLIFQDNTSKIPVVVSIEELETYQNSIE